MEPCPKNPLIAHAVSLGRRMILLQSPQGTWNLPRSYTMLEIVKEPKPWAANYPISRHLGVLAQRDAWTAQSAAAATLASELSVSKELRQRLADSEALLNQNRSKADDAAGKLALAEQTLSSERDTAQEKLKPLMDAKQALTDQFKALANDFWRRNPPDSPPAMLNKLVCCWVPSKISCSSSKRRLRMSTSLRVTPDRPWRSKSLR